MSDSRFIVAFEIGSSKIKGSLGSVSPNGTISILAIEEEPLVDAVRYGSIRKVQEVSDRILNVARRLESNRAIAGGRITAAYVSLGGLSLMSSNTKIERHFATDTEITPELIRQIKNQVKSAGIPERDIVAVVTRDFVVDTLPQKNPIGTFCHELKAGVTMLTCRQQLKSNIERVFTERLSMRINGYIIRHQAIASTVLTEDEKQLGCMLVDFGAETTTVAIYKNGSMRYLATIPMGSRNITRDLTALKCLEKRAEEIKKVIGNVDPQQNMPGTSFDGLDNTEINNYIAARTGEIITNIIEQTNYAKIDVKDLPAGIVVVGGGAKLRGFVELLTSRSMMKVRRGVPSGPIRINDVQMMADNVDIISLMVTAARQEERQCVEISRPVDEPVYDDGESRVGSEMGEIDNTVDDYTDDEKKTTKTKAPHRSKFESMLTKVRNIVYGDENDYFTGENDKAKN